ncbi:MAG: glutamine-hydrolyzing GMP synthase [Ignavibacteriales bacterium]|nr:glutamine-hydrolyzing GMP synthase [Ignavibacteriales bacterium]
MQHDEWLLVLDFGSQYTQLIARRIRELGVYSEIHPFNYPVEKIRERKPLGVILSGSPSSVSDKNAPKSSGQIFNLGVPVLGICYGLQLIADQFGGRVDPSARREFGKANLVIDSRDDLFAGLDGETTVWMSHGDALSEIPPGFEPIGHTSNAPICAIRNPARKIFGVQFHPEVVHTPDGTKILSNFALNVCQAKGNWTSSAFIDQAVAEIKSKVGTSRVLCALSGGVDSSVAAVLLHKAIGDRLHCVHINNGLMRTKESDLVVETFRKTFRIDLTFVDASDIFLSRLRGVTDPEQKRKIIGKTFIDVFEEHAKKIESDSEAQRKGRFEFLAQGTLYPDVIESVSFKGPSVTIKTHHNVGGLPETMNFRLVEPFRELFKDEVRAVGKHLGISEELIRRHPFPGPGFAVRVLGEITKEKLAIVRSADDIFVQEVRKAGLYDQLWQAFAVLLPVQSVGVMGDGRTYESTVALRAVTSVDGMTADWARLPHDLLASASNRIINEVRGVNRVVFDVSSKPPSTIEWE